MKLKKYIIPETRNYIPITPFDLCENLPVESNPNEDDILSKERDEDFVPIDEDKNEWDSGLW